MPFSRTGEDGISNLIRFRRDCSLPTSQLAAAVSYDAGQYYGDSQNNEDAFD